MRVTIDHDLCENTGACEMICPEDVFEKGKSRMSVVNPGACSNCWLCVDGCAGSAINID